MNNRNFWVAFSLFLNVFLLIAFFYNKPSSNQMQEVVGINKLQEERSYIVSRIQEDSREIYDGYLDSNKELAQKRYLSEGSIFSKMVDIKNIEDNGYLDIPDTEITDEVSRFISQDKPTAVIFSSKECIACDGLLKALDHDIAQLGREQIIYVSSGSPAPDQNAKTFHITDLQKELALELGIRKWPTTLIFENGMLKGALPYRDMIVANEEKGEKLYRQAYIMALLKVLQGDSQKPL